jgi:hypothetical protein
MGHLHFTVGVFVDGQGVDYADGVAVAQPFQLLDDLPWKLGWLNPKTMSCTGPMAMLASSLAVADG